MSKETQILDLIQEISTDNVLRIERWKDDYKHWRVGINWFSEDEYDFITEKPTLDEAILTVADYLRLDI